MAFLFPYSRAQALSDGKLIDVSQMANAAGLPYEVAVTDTVWKEVVVLNDVDRALGQSEDGRLWDVVYMLKVAFTSGRNVKAERTNTQTKRFYTLYVRRGGELEMMTLKAMLHPGDSMAMVWTIMREQETVGPVSFGYTPALWQEVIALSDVDRARGESEEERLQQVFAFLNEARIRGTNREERSTSSTLYYWLPIKRNGEVGKVTVKAKWLPDEDGDPMIVAMMPDED